MSDTAPGGTQETAEKKKVLVWDLPTRLFHWLLVISLVGSWWTMEFGADYDFDYVWWHFSLGYFAAGLLIFRILWGFVGPRHARFGNFLRGPGAVIGYMRTLIQRDSKPHAGHNPLGGLVVLLILLAIGAQIGTGLFATDDIFSFGPFYPLVDAATADSLTSWHHTIFDVLKILALLHVAAIIFYLIWKRQNLTGPMLTGRKQADASESIPSSRFWLGLILAAIAGAIVWAAVTNAPEPAEDEFGEFY